MSAPEGEDPDGGPDALIAVEPNGDRPARKPSSGKPPAKPVPGLHVVATPIGNAGDITLRALETLAGVDVIACEDTRITGPLMARYGIRRPLIAYHEHNAARLRPQLLDRMAAGEAVALVSDAGTPLISDPGYKLVRDARDRGLAVTHLPGASAVLTALVLAGLPSDRFLFVGFLPAKSAARKQELAGLAAIGATLVFYESAQRLADFLADAAATLGPRDAAVTRELTKMFEEVRRGALADLARHYAEAGPPRGEIVVVVGPPQAAAADADDLDALLRDALGRLSVRDAAAVVAEASGRPRKEVYRRALALSAEPAPE